MLSARSILLTYIRLSSWLKMSSFLKPLLAQNQAYFRNPHFHRLNGLCFSVKAGLLGTNFNPPTNPFAQVGSCPLEFLFYPLYGPVLKGYFRDFQTPCHLNYILYLIPLFMRTASMPVIPLQPCLDNSRSHRQLE